MAYNYLYKLLIIGDENTGKTNICNRMSGNPFNVSYDHTIGIEFSTCFTKVDSEIIKCQLWDTSGKRIFAPVLQSYYKGVIGIIIVYDVTNLASFKRIDYWLDQIRNNKPKDEEVEILLIGNKIDKRNRVITWDMGQKKALDNKLLFFETSALDKENNISEIKREFCKVIFNNYDSLQSHPGVQEPKNVIVLQEPNEETMLQDCCCCS
jgi:small GTP-binding protein